MQKLVSIPVILLIFCNVLIGQYEIINSQKVGGSGEENVLDVFRNPDGSFLICGKTASNDGIFETNYGNGDAYLIFFNSKGEKEWVRNYGGSENDQISSIYRQTDGGYFLTGSTASNDHDLLGDTITNGDQPWLLSIDEVGNIIWSKKLMIERKGDSAIRLTNKDNHELLVSQQYTRESDSIRVFSLSLYTVSGVEKWNREIAIPEVTNFKNFSFINDSTIILSASKVSENQTSNTLLMEVNIFNEELNWIREYGGQRNDYGSFTIDPEGNYWIVGSTSSFSQNAQTSWHYDFWLMKINKNGEYIWQRTYGSSSSDFLFHISFSSDRILLAGSSFRGDLDVSDNYGCSDIWILELERDGNIIAQKNFGGSKCDGSLINIVPYCDGEELIMVATTMSIDLDIPPGLFDEVHNNQDLWVTKLRRKTDEPEEQKCSGLVYPNPVPKGDPIYISSPNIHEDANLNISLYDVAGRLVNSSNTGISYNALCEQELLRVQLSDNNQNQVSGIYLLNILDDSKSCTYKLFFE